MPITVDSMLSELRIIANEAPADYVYERPLGQASCLYVHDSQEPGCIMGQWLFRFHGVSLETLATFEGNSVSSILENELGMDGWSDVATMARRIQHYQDDEIPWRKAITRAELDFRNVVFRDIFGYAHVRRPDQYV